MKARLQFTLHTSGPYRSGDIVRGILTVSVPRLIESGVGQFLLVFQGYEQATVEYTETTTSTDHHHSGNSHTTHNRVTKTDEDRHDLFQPIVVPIPNKDRIILPGGRIEAGTYQVPFSCQFPRQVQNGQGLPASFHRSTGSGKNSVDIIYSLHAHLSVPGSIFGYKKLEQEQVLEVLASPSSTIPNKVEPLMTKPSTFPMISGLIATKKHGDISCSAKLLNSHLAPGQSPQVKICVFNDSRATITKVHLVLKQAIRANAKSHAKSDDMDLTFRTVTAGLAGKPDIKGGLSEAEKQQKWERIRRELNKPIHPHDPTVFTLPPISVKNAIPSYASGKKVVVNHFLKVTLHTTSGYHNIEMATLPVTIVEKSNSGAGASVASAAAAIPVAAAAVVPSAPYEDEVKGVGLPVASATPIYNLDSGGVPAAAAATSIGGVADEVEC